MQPTRPKFFLLLALYALVGGAMYWLPLRGSESIDEESTRRQYWPAIESSVQQASD